MPLPCLPQLVNMQDSFSRFIVLATEVERRLLTKRQLHPVACFVYMPDVGMVYEISVLLMMIHCLGVFFKSKLSRNNKQTAPYLY